MPSSLPPSPGGLPGDLNGLKEAGFSAFLSRPSRPVDLPDTLAFVRATVGGAVPKPFVTRHSLVEFRASEQRHIVTGADVACNGKEAVAMWLRQTCDAILMDREMPEMDGYEATLEIRRIESQRTRPPARRIPVRALTASAMDSDTRSHLFKTNSRAFPRVKAA
jgi:CheY-like chemotaxis protein